MSDPTQPAAPRDGGAPDSPGPKEGHGRLFRTMRAFLPPWMAKLIDVWGLGVLVGFLLAAAVGLGALHLKWIPATLLPGWCDPGGERSKPQTEPTKPQPQPKVKPGGTADVESVEPDPQGFFVPIEQWLRKEGSSIHDTAQFGSDTAEIQTKLLPSTTEFTWVLGPRSDSFEIFAWAFRVTGPPESRLYQPLKGSQQAVDKRKSMVFMVPQREKDDRLIAIVRVFYPANAGVSFKDTFLSVFK